MAQTNQASEGSRTVSSIIFVLAFILTFICVINYAISTETTFWRFAIFLALIADIIALAVYIIVSLLTSIESQTRDIADSYDRLLTKFDSILKELNTLNENILLSDDAKALAYRKKDLQALQDAIEEELSNRNWESASYLIDQLENRFGHKTQAEIYREKLKSLQNQKLQEKLETARKQFQTLLASHDWKSAHAEIEKIKSELPNGEKIADEWKKELENAKTEHKKELLREWDQAVKNNEIDKGIEILKELDKYLTPNEVAALEESARGIFRAKLHDLGMQFSLFVTEKMWDKAYEVGLQIVNEFPNSRMANEIKEKLDVLKANAQVVKNRES